MADLQYIFLKNPTSAAGVIANTTDGAAYNSITAKVIKFDHQALDPSVAVLHSLVLVFSSLTNSNEVCWESESAPLLFHGENRD